MPSIQLIQYVLKAAIRDRLILAMVTLIALSVGMSAFMASSAMLEKQQFLTVYASGSLRVLGVLGLVLFCVFFIRRSFETKDIEFLLSRPIGRVTFIVSYASAFSVLAAFTAFLCSFALFIIMDMSLNEALLLWGYSLVVENIIMVTIAFFFSMVLSSPATAVLMTLAFYVLARMMGEILGILDAGFAYSLMDGLQMAMNMVSAVTPRLDLLGQTTWLVYGIGQNVDVMFVTIQGVLAVFLILVLALIDLICRQF